MRNLPDTRIALSDGSVLEVRAHRLRVTAATDERGPEATSVGARMGWWLGVSGAALTQRWSATPATRAGRGSADAESGATVLLVDVGGASEGIRANGSVVTGEIAGRPLRVRWMGPVERTATTERVFGRALDEAAMESSWVRAALVLAERSPLTRWRSRLARGVLLGPESGPGDDPNAAPDEKGGDVFDDPVVEALARTIEAQWAVGLSRLASEDAAAARRVVERLCTTLDFGGGVMAPGWPMDAERLTGLVNLLLEPGLEVGDAAAWLDDAPDVLCWVIDDAGGADAATGAPEGTIGVANLMERPVASWVESASARGGPHIVAVSPRSVRPVPTGATPANEGSPLRLQAETAARGVRTRLQVGEMSFDPTVYSRRVPALAPGITIGSLHADWSLERWLLAGQDMEYSMRLGAWGAGGGGGDATTGLVYRGVDAPLERGASMPDRWLVFLDVVDRVEETEGFVRVWLGPSGRSRCVLKVMRDGRVLDESPSAPGGAAGDIPRLARVVETARGWTCWLSIPPSAIDSDGLLQVGIEQVDGRGARSSWPRPMLPWQREPGRLGIGTSTWSDR
jgi:hypothetical protein